MATKSPHKCNQCNYLTFKLFNLNRHQNSKHPVYEQSQENVIFHRENVMPNEANVMPNEANVMPNLENVMSGLNNGFLCIKCNKHYKNKKYLIAHESKCKGVDILTCPKCMKSFSNRHNKSAHIKRDTCKARSIVHARVPNIQNITNNNTTNNNTTNNITNIDNSITNNNNIIINNFGSERIDYLTFDNLQ